METMTHPHTMLEGKTISKVRHMKQKEITMYDWHDREYETTVIEFTDGTYAVVMQDPEGNGSGWLEVDNYNN